MNKNKTKLILQELVEKSKDFKDGFLFPDTCELNLSELEHFDFIIFRNLEETRRLLWSSESNYFNKTEKVFVPVLRMENDKVSFVPRIVREYLKELGNE